MTVYRIVAWVPAPTGNLEHGGFWDAWPETVPPEQRTEHNARSILHRPGMRVGALVEVAAPTLRAPGGAFVRVVPAEEMPS